MKRLFARERVISSIILYPPSIALLSNCINTGLYEASNESITILSTYWSLDPSQLIKGVSSKLSANNDLQRYDRQWYKNFIAMIRCNQSFCATKAQLGHWFSKETIWGLKHSGWPWRPTSILLSISFSPSSCWLCPIIYFRLQINEIDRLSLRSNSPITSSAVKLSRMVSLAALRTLSSESRSPKRMALKFWTPSCPRQRMHSTLARGWPLIMPYMNSS